MPVASTVTT